MTFKEEQLLATKIFNKELPLFDKFDQSILCLSKTYCINQIILYKIRTNNIYGNLTSCLKTIKSLSL